MIEYAKYKKVKHRNGKYDAMSTKLIALLLFVVLVLCILNIIVSDLLRHTKDGLLPTEIFLVPMTTIVHEFHSDEFLHAEFNPTFLRNDDDIEIWTRHCYDTLWNPLWNTILTLPWTILTTKKHQKTIRIRRMTSSESSLLPSSSTLLLTAQPIHVFRPNAQDPRPFRIESTGDILVHAIFYDEKVGRYQLTISRWDETMAVLMDTKTIVSDVTEKNWSLVCASSLEDILFLTNASPCLCFRRYNYITNQWKIDGNFDTRTVSRMTTGKEDGLRCTSACVPYKPNTWLTLFHTFRPYRTVFAEIDVESRTLLRVSPPVQFFNKSFIEFPSGLLRKSDGVYWIGLGVDDQRAVVIEMMYEDIEKLFFKIS
jgi:hypothetical protein